MLDEETRDLIRALFNGVDIAVAEEIRQGGFDKATVLGVLTVLRAKVRAHDPRLAELLIPVRSEYTHRESCGLLRAVERELGKPRTGGPA
ncbi:MAG TPA: hypothetical protein VF614_00990 [Chthoniobacteraceae bacterium]|jgi:hypothetical protein